MHSKTEFSSPSRGLGDVYKRQDVDAVSFTGSTEVGGYFLKYSSESNLKPVALETVSYTHLTLPTT